MMKKINVPVLIMLLVILAYADRGNEYTSEKEEILTARVIMPVEEITKQESYQLIVEMSIADGWHINSNQPLEDFLIPTNIKFNETVGISFGKIRYIKPELRKFLFSDTKMSVYEGKVYALTTITISPNTKVEELQISGNIFYQACNDQSCLAPAQYYIAALLPVRDSNLDVTIINQDIFAKVLPQFEDKIASTGNKEFSNVIEESGLFYAFIFIFLGGLALNLTPCVYPLIPITISYFGGQSKGNRTALVLRAGIYVFGMSITYSILGVLAALTGNLLGSALQNPLVLIFVALVMVVSA